MTAAKHRRHGASARLAQAKETQDRDNHDDKADDVDNVVHLLPFRDGEMPV
jgi:hypothetical protein